MAFGTLCSGWKLSMSSLIVEVTQIDEIIPHPNADRLELAKVKGWVCVIPKETYKVGDLCVYIPIDSILPHDLEEKLFSTSKVKLTNSRIRTIKIRGAISQGLVVSIKDLDLGKVKLGQDVREKLGITKHEPPEPFIGVKHTNKNKGTKKQPNPHFVKYTDIENFKNHPNEFVEDELVSVSEKVHGCLQAKTRVLLADCTTKTIKEIVDKKLDVELLGMDKNGALIPTKITNWFNNGEYDDWFYVGLKRNKFTRLDHVFCTGNHRFFNPNFREYKYTPELNVGTRQYTQASDLTMNDYALVVFVKEQLNGTPAPLKTTCPIILISRVDLRDKRQYRHKMDRTRYDLETTTGNFIANNTLVHNSNFRAGIVPVTVDTFWKRVKRFFGKLPSQEFVYGSHNVQLQNHSKMTTKVPKGFFYKSNIYLETVIKYDLVDLLQDEVNTVMYGEIYGDGVQKGYKYDCGPGERKLVIYDVMINGKYLNQDKAREWCLNRGLPFVPILYTGPFSSILAKQLSEGPSVLAPEQKVREGIVIKPTQETTTHLGRKVLKLINDEYLLKEQTDFH